MDNNDNAALQEAATNNQEFDLSSFNFFTNENTGELEVAPTKTAEQLAADTNVQTEQQTQQIANPNAEFESRIAGQFTNLENIIARQNNAIQLLLQAQAKQLEPTPVDLGEENNAVVNEMANRVVKPLEQRFANLEQQMNPVLAKQQVDNMVAQFVASVPDANEYFAGMTYLMQTMPHMNWDLRSAYIFAKQMNLKAQPNPATKPNVTDINTKRELPNKVESNNTQLKSRDIRPGRPGLKDAMEAAMEELGYGT